MGIRSILQIVKLLCLFGYLPHFFTKVALAAFKKRLNAFAFELRNYEFKNNFSSTKLHFQIERWMKEKAIDADKINLENEQQAKLVF